MQCPLENMPVPLKCLAYAVECLCQFWLSSLETSRKSPRPIATELDTRDTKIALALEEDCPAILLETSVLNRVLADLDLEGGPDRNAKAVKDNKTKAPCGTSGPCRCARLSTSPRPCCSLCFRIIVGASGPVSVER